MIALGRGKFIRISPKKVRQIINLIRGEDVPTSLDILTHTAKSPSPIIMKLLRSAISSAKQKGFTEEQLFISKIIADQGPTWKRFKAAAFGRATPILKKTTHLTIELELKKS